MVERGAERGAAIIRQLLTFSRGIEGPKGTVQLKHLVKEMVLIIRETFPRNIEVRATTPSDLWLVDADATQLYQVLMNLCVNARDAMPNGGTLAITAANQCLTEEAARAIPFARPGDHVVVTVADSGSGIPHDILGRIFEPFFTTKGPGRGTGLGLSTVRNIVKNHGGCIAVASEPGKGTEFRVYLPAVAAPGPESAEPVLAAPQGSGELVLLVDDESSVREATRQILEANQYDVITASNGAEASRAFFLHRPRIRLVLTDLMMPIMDGEQLIRALRSIESGVRFVAMSGLDEGPRQDELRLLGVREFLTKPFSATELLNVVHRALETEPV
jgi:CheY-like chemotaxis protein